MGNLLQTKKAAYPHRPFPFTHDLNNLDVNTQRYFVCRGYGKSDGDRIWECSSSPWDEANTNLWLRTWKENEAKVDAPRRQWETPYVYMAVKTEHSHALEHVLGRKPVYTSSPTSPQSYMPIYA